MKQYEIQIDNEKIMIEQDDDGKFIIPNKFRLQGRFPSNVILECTCDEVIEGKEEIVSIHDAPKGTFAGGEPNRGSIKNYRERNVGKNIIHTNPECPCYMLDKQSGISKSRQNIISDNRKNQGKSMFLDGVRNPENSYSDLGGASRFFYVAKASRSERFFYCKICKDVFSMDKVSNHRHGENGITKNLVFHPTQKPIKLMEYLCLLTKTPTGGIVLDPFAGSGTTGMACKKTGRSYILIEKDPEYVEIAKRRIDATMGSLF